MLRITPIVLVLLAVPTFAQDVPLVPFKNARFPNGLALGTSFGITFADYDADGWPDIIVGESGNVWQNRFGNNWRKALDLDTVLPAADRRYGVSLGDYNADGLPDIATEPRALGQGDTCFHLLKNLGGGPNFIDVAFDPQVVVGAPCTSNAETYCWGDVDGDGDLDLFLPIYAISPSPGNKFLENLGPTGPGGAYQLQERTRAANLDNPSWNNRAEGAQFVDVDFDGDIDLYSNGTLYKNASTGTPRFGKITSVASGIGFPSALDEGAAFLDYDLDGDYDLFVAYVQFGMRIWENRGDGFFFNAPNVFEDPSASSLGFSMADWDNDGDEDVTTQNLFHENKFIEEGVRKLAVATHTIIPNRIRSATPAWADWDRDGDLDCALGNFGGNSFFYENTLYDASTLDADRRYVRVRVVRDHPTVVRGLETEYGANVEILPRAQSTLNRFKKFVASGHGYVNQNEYTLHFGLPPRTAQPLAFDVVVDFPGLSGDGILRVDRFVNPALGGIELETLVDREITVFRSGKVVLDGVAYPSSVNDFSLRLTTTTNGLRKPINPSAPPAPMLAPGAQYFAGIELVTQPDAGPVVVTELILDGQLGREIATAEGAYDFAVWDVTRPSFPKRIFTADLTTKPRNHRSRFYVSFVLEPGRRYRAVASVARLRATPIAGPFQHDELTVTGGLSFQDHDPATGRGVVATDVDPTNVYLALRYRARLTVRDPVPAVRKASRASRVAGATRVR